MSHAPQQVLSHIHNQKIILYNICTVRFKLSSIFFFLLFFYLVRSPRRSSYHLHAHRPIAHPCLIEQIQHLHRIISPHTRVCHSHQTATTHEMTQYSSRFLFFSYFFFSIPYPSQTPFFCFHSSFCLCPLAWRSLSFPIPTRSTLRICVMLCCTTCFHSQYYSFLLVRWGYRYALYHNLFPPKKTKTKKNLYIVELYVHLLVCANSTPLMSMTTYAKK